MLTSRMSWTQGEVLLFSFNFLGHRLVSGNPKKQDSTAIPLQECCIHRPIWFGVLKSSGCALNYETMDLRSTKFRCIVTIKVLLLYAVIVFNTRDPSTLISATTLSPKSRSKGRTVADSIAERLTRPTAYKFKTDCSIIPVWEKDVYHRVFVWNAHAWSSDATYCEVDFLTSTRTSLDFPRHFISFGILLPKHHQSILD
ncbi:hypothetical protein Tco_0648425 [Tanacetum coccineum]